MFIAYGRVEWNWDPLWNWDSG